MTLKELNKLMGESSAAVDKAYEALEAAYQRKAHETEIGNLRNAYYKALGYHEAMMAVQHAAFNKLMARKYKKAVRA